MAKILILGGYGLTGKLLGWHLLAESDAQILIAGRHLEKARHFADELNATFPGERAVAVYVDAADSQSLRDALQDVSLLLVAAPTTRWAGNVIHAALDCGVDYLDIQLGAQKTELLKSLSAQIEQAGLCFITEAGFHPGLPSAMVRFAASRFDRLETALTACYLNMGKAMPYSEAVDELMEAFQNYQAQVFKQGSWTKSGSYDVRQFDFGGEIGRRTCFSMFFEEMRNLPQMYPSLEQTGFYISSSHWLVDWVITPVAMAGLKLFPRRGLRPMGRLVWWGMQNLPGPPYLVLLKVEARGQKEGKPSNFEARISHVDGYQLTAIPVVACLLQYLDGTARRPGVWMMGHLAEPDRLFRDMERMGLVVAVSDA